MMKDVTRQLMTFGITKLGLNEKIVKGDLSEMDKDE